MGMVTGEVPLCWTTLELGVPVLDKEEVEDDDPTALGTGEMRRRSAGGGLETAPFKLPVMDLKVQILS